MWNLVEYIAASLGIIGGLLVAFRRRSGYIAWLIGNAMWVVFGIKHGNWGLATQFAVFWVIASIGYWYWGKEEN
jgi:nicotinamide riboside transporter PnuC